MNFIEFFKNFGKKENTEDVASSEANKSKEAAKERLHLVLMQDRVNVSVDFLDLMKQEIINVMKKYIEVDENEIDVRFINKSNEDGTNGSPALYANIPIVSIKNDIVMNTKKEDISKVSESVKSVNNASEGVCSINNEVSEKAKKIKKSEINDNNEIKGKIVSRNVKKSAEPTINKDESDINEAKTVKTIKIEQL